jgi:hypothetical protein
MTSDPPPCIPTPESNDQRDTLPGIVEDVKLPFHPGKSYVQFVRKGKQFGRACLVDDKVFDDALTKLNDAGQDVAIDWRKRNLSTS